MFYYLKMMGKFWWVLLIATVITTGSAVYLTYYYLPYEYKASTTMYILKRAPSEDGTRPRNGDTIYQDLLASEMLVKDYKEIVKSGIILQTVRDELKLEIPELRRRTLDDMSEKISVKVKTGTRIVAVDVTDRNPEAAAKIANTIARVFKDKSMELLNTDNVTIIDEASVPIIPETPKPVRDIALGAMSGFSGGVVIILFIGYFRKQIKLEKEAGAKETGKAVKAETAEIGAKPAESTGTIGAAL